MLSLRSLRLLTLLTPLVLSAGAGLLVLLSLVLLLFALSKLLTAVSSIEMSIPLSEVAIAAVRRAQSLEAAKRAP
jgi:hypothetical protein